MEAKGKKNKHTAKKIAALLFVAAAAGLIITEAMGLTHVLQGLLNPEMGFVEAAAITYEVAGTPQAHGTDSGFFLLIGNGIRFHNTEGVEVFRDYHAMINPMLFGRGNFAAVAERGGGTVNIYNTSGLVNRVATGGPITSLTLAQTGFFAVITYEGDSFYIQVFDNFGQRDFYGPHVCAGIMPMLTDISRDGRILAISYLDKNDARLNSFVNFVFLNRADYFAHDYVDGIFASNRNNPDQIIGALRFMANGNLVAASDTRIFAIEPSSGVTIWEIPLGNHVSHFYVGDDWLAVAYGDAMLNRQGRPAHTIAAYNQLGEELFALPSGGRVDSLSMQGSSLIFGVDGRFTALTRQGQLLWEHSLPGNVSGFAMLGSHERIAAVWPAQTKVLHRVRQ